MNNEISPRIHDVELAHTMALAEAQDYAPAHNLQIPERLPGMASIVDAGLSQAEAASELQYEAAHSPRQYWHSVQDSAVFRRNVNIGEVYYAKTRVAQIMADNPEPFLKIAKVVTPDYAATDIGAFLELSPEARMRLLPGRGEVTKALYGSLVRNIENLPATSESASHNDPHLPTLDMLSDDYRQQVELSLYADWSEYLELLHEALPKSVMNPRAKGHQALLYNRLDGLKQELTQADEFLTRERIIRLFRYRDFHKRCDNSRDAARQRAASDVYYPKKAIREMIQESDQASSNDVLRTFAASRTPGEQLVVDKPEMADEVLAVLHGKLVEEAAQKYGLPAAKLWHASLKKKISEVIRPKNFHGRLLSTRLEYLPVSDEYAEAYMNSFVDDYENSIVCRIGIFTDMHSTGRGKVGESFQDVVIYTSQSKAQPDFVKLRSSIRKNLSGDKVAEYLRSEASEIAIAEEVRNLKKPVRVGIPGLGKR